MPATGSLTKKKGDKRKVDDHLKSPIRNGEISREPIPKDRGQNLTSDMPRDNQSPPSSTEKGLEKAPVTEESSSASTLGQAITDRACSLGRTYLEMNEGPFSREAIELGVKNLR